MNQLIRKLCSIGFAALCALSATAQARIPEPEVERETRVDDEGLRQWAEWKETRCKTCLGRGVTKCAHCERLRLNNECLECDMKKESTCRACGGSGSPPDPLEKVVCPACHGAGIYPCDACRSEGVHMITGGGDKPHDCSACRGEGAYPCEVCKGARLVPAAKLKPSVAQAPLKTLRRAREQIEESLELLGELEPTGKNSRDEVKQFKKIVAPASRSLPDLKKSERMLEKVIKKLAMADVWRGNDEKRALAVKRYAEFTRVYLLHQKQLIDLCIERAEFNAEVLEKKKKK